MKRTVYILMLLALSYQNLKSQTWSAVGTGFNYTATNIKVDNTNGDIYVSSASGGTINVFKYNGSVWSALGSGFNNFIRSIEIYNNEVYVCGAFSTADGNSVNKIAKWNGTTWVAIGAGISAPGIADASILKVYNNKLYIGGYFSQVGGSITAMGIASWDGSNWSSLSTGTSGGWVYSMNIFNNNLIIGGDFTSIGGVTTKGVASWNGVAFNSLGSGLIGTTVNVTAIDTLNNELYVGGVLNSYNNIAKWNGSSWSQVGDGFNGGVSDILNYNNQIIAGGSFTSSGTLTVNNFAKLTGTNWTSFGNGSNNDVMCFGKYNSTLYVGGAFTNIDNTIISNLAKYSNTTTNIKSIENYTESFIIYPNPSINKTFTVDFKENNTIHNVIIYDMLGNVMYSKETSSKIMFSLEYNTGVYFLNIDGIVKKLILN